MLYTKKGGCKLQAHRGVSTDCPENTLSAFRAAIEQGYELIELDPNLTADGELVILHDPTLNRTGRGRNGQLIEKPLPIRSLALKQAREYDFGLWFSPQFKGEVLPTLKETMDLIAPTTVQLKLDNKVQGFAPVEIERLFDEVAAHPAAEKVGFTCSDMEYLKAVARRFPQNPLHYDGQPSKQIFEEIRAVAPKAPLTLWLRYDNRHTAWCKTPPADADLAATAKVYGSLGLWLISDPEEARQAIDEYGADVIETTGTLKPQGKAPNQGEIHNYRVTNGIWVDKRRKYV